MTKNNNITAAWAAIGLTAIAFAALIALHFLSPEFDPSFRMVSEYAYDYYSWVLSVMFLAGGLNSWALAAALWPRITTKRGKIGLWFLLFAGLGSALASIFDITHIVGHNIAGILGVGCVPAAALLITGSIRRASKATGDTSAMRWAAHLTWISIVLLVVSMIIMTAQFAHIYGKLPEQAPTTLPQGVLGLAGWADRLVLLAAYAWIIITARYVTKNSTYRP
jgi:hypothetical protein